MSVHAIDDYFTEDEAKQAREAAAMARVTGSQGSTERREYRGSDGKLHSVTEVSVEAIEGHRRGFGPAYRVTTHQNMVIVLASRPGRYHGHSAPEEDI